MALTRTVDRRRLARLALPGRARPSRRLALCCLDEIARHGEPGTCRAGRIPIGCCGSLAADTAPGRVRRQTHESDMAALRIFISHSSRLRDDEASDPLAQANWQLLQDTCGELSKVYGDKIEVLVDYQELHPGDEWERRLHVMLADGDAALILFTRRALKESDWVKIETTILVHRRLLDPEFQLFSVTLPGQTTPADLEHGGFRELHLARWQVVPNAASAEEIVRAIQPTLGDPATLPGKRQTAFQRKLVHLAQILEAAGRDTLVDRWDALCPGTPPRPTHLHPAQRYAWAIAEFLLSEGDQALARARQVLRREPAVLRGQPAEDLLKCLNALWVEAAAAALLREPDAGCLALNGFLVAREDREHNDRPYYTLNRYCKRAWPESREVRLIPLARRVESASEIKDQIRDKYQGGRRFPLSDDELGRRLAEDGQVIVFLAATLWPEGTIDQRLVGELQNLKARYRPLVFVVGIDGEMRDDLPDGVQKVLPALDLANEDRQYATENDAWTLINR